jgi:hypothetical protein
MMAQVKGRSFINIMLLHESVQITRVTRTAGL